MGDFLVVGADARLLSSLQAGRTGPGEVRLHAALGLSEVPDLLAKQSFDVLFLDQATIGGEVGTAIRGIHAKAPGLPVVLLCGEDGAVAAGEWIAGGAHDCLVKSDLSPERVWRSIEFSRARARAEQALRESEKQFRQAFELSQSGLCLIGADGRLQQVNRALCELMRCEATVLIGQRAELFVHPAERPDFGERLARLLRGEQGSMESFERRIRQDGTLIWSRSSATRLGGDGNSPLFLHQVQDVTAEELHRLQLEGERLLLEQVMNMVPDAIFFKDREGRFTRLNPAAMGRLGRQTSREVLGATDADFFAPDQCRQSRIEEDEILRTGLPSLQHETREIWQDGRTTWITRSKLPLRDEKGRIVGVVGVVHDITERKQAEEALRTSEQQYRMLFDLLPGPMWVQDVETSEILAVNEAAIAHYGFTREEFLAMSARDLVMAGESEAAGIAQGTRLWRHRKKDGTVIVVEIATRTISFNGREAEYALIRDVTDRVRSERALRESEERYRAVVEQVADAILLVDPESLLILQANQSAQRLLGYSLEELRQRSIFDVCAHSEDQKLADYNRVLEYRNVPLGPAPAIRRDGSIRQVDRDGSMISYGGRDVICIVARDIQGRIDLESQLRHAQKMEAVGRLAGGVAHDFNNILTVITGYCDDILSRLPVGGEVQECLREIAAAADRAAGLTRQLLAFGRKQVLRPSAIDLNEKIAEIGSILRRVIGEDIEMNTLALADPAVIEADSSQIGQVVLNLAVNARDAMPRGGSLAIETRKVKVDEPRLHDQEVVTPGDYVVLEIRDTGVGMDGKTLARAFEPFFSTKGEKGTGLGLSTVYGIVKQSGGFISARSEPGNGTSFQVYFPAATTSQVAQPSDWSRPERISGTETILLVEDQAEVRAVTRQMLESQGYRVLATEDGDGALDAARTWPGRIDVLVTDIVMPKVSGPELAKEVVKLRPGIRCLFISGYAEQVVTAREAFAQANWFLEKPFHGVELATKIRELLAAPLGGERATDAGPPASTLDPPPGAGRK